MEQYHLPLFIFNTLIVLADAALGYHFAPRLLAGMGEPEAVEAGVRTTRKLLPVIVALYMFFNCMGYFQGRTVYLLAVSGLILVDMVLQLLLRRKRRGIKPL
ncbi:MAG: hypothetical protein A2X83_08285 [Desulfuromonadales bacterium GWD2_54_10]|nr:MAG: hypothetical protein A2X83_08285 [Desulfuromonadales bacterium GWD2_54_10]